MRKGYISCVNLIFSCWGFSVYLLMRLLLGLVIVKCNKVVVVIEVSKVSIRMGSCCKIKV